MPPATPEKPDLPAGKPWNPSKIGWFRVFPPFFFIRLSLNWKRLGKPDWVMESMILGIFVLISTIALFVYNGQTFDYEVQDAFPLALLFAAGLGQLVYAGMLQRLQRAPYQKYLRGDIAGMLNHQYNLIGALAIGLGITAFIIFGLGGALTLSWQPKTFENEALAMTYKADWKPIEPSGLRVCQNHFAGCFFALETSVKNTLMTFTTYPLQNATHQEYINFIKSDMVSKNLNVLAHQESVINNAPAFWQEFLVPQDDGDVAKFLEVYVFTNTGQVIEISGYANEEIFENRVDDMWKIINDIQLK